MTEEHPDYKPLEDARGDLPAPDSPPAAAAVPEVTVPLPDGRSLTLHEPTAGELRGVALLDLLQLDTGAAAPAIERMSELSAEEFLALPIAAALPIMKAALDLLQIDGGMPALVSEVTVREPSAGELRGVKLLAVLRLDPAAHAPVIGRCTTMTPAQFYSLPISRALPIMAELLNFFAPRGSLSA